MRMVKDHCCLVVHQVDHAVELSVCTMQRIRVIDVLVKLDVAEVCDQSALDIC